jgi:hypothetical protein
MGPGDSSRGSSSAENFSGSTPLLIFWFLLTWALRSLSCEGFFWKCPVDGCRSDFPVDLDHGSVQVSSTRGVKVRVNCMTVVPLTQEWTRYDVIDADGKVLVAAHENDVQIHFKHGPVRRSKNVGSSDVTVHRGEQVIRSEHAVQSSSRDSRPPPTDRY